MGESVSGELAVKVATLFDRKVDGGLVPASGAAASRYSSWMNFSNTYGFRNVRFVSGDGDEFAPHFVDNPELNKRMQTSVALLQDAYDHAWVVRKYAVLHSMPNLSKAASTAPFGLNGCGFVPTCAVADREFAYSVETLEDLLRSAVSTDLASEKEINAFLSAPAGRNSATYAGSVATAISMIVSSLMPYRSDGAITVLAGNKAMFSETEFWANHSTNSPFRQGDCEDSAGEGMAIVNAIGTHSKGASVKEFPFVVASANALLHHTPAIAILTASAAHADISSEIESESHVAGHAVLALIKNTELLSALHKASTSSIGTDTTLNASSALGDSTKASTLADNRLYAMFPPMLCARLPRDEVALIKKGWSAVQDSDMFKDISNFLVAEGTSWSASRVYTHDTIDRAERAESFEASNSVLKSLSPSVMRAFRWMDADTHADTHAFYRTFTELALLPSSGLCTHPELRATGDATGHLVLTQDSVNGIVDSAGASPKDLATGAFSAIPLFTVDQTSGTVLDEAMWENKRNTMRPPRGVYALSDLQVVNMDVSLRALRNLKELIPRKTARSDMVEASWLVSFAALANNPQGVRVFVDEIATREGVAGDVDIHAVRGLAVNGKNGEDMGVLVTLNMWLPRM
jgi:hypothetical protein